MNRRPIILSLTLIAALINIAPAWSEPTPEPQVSKPAQHKHLRKHKPKAKPSAASNESTNAAASTAPAASSVPASATPAAAAIVAPPPATATQAPSAYTASAPAVPPASTNPYLSPSATNGNPYLAYTQQAGPASAPDSTTPSFKSFGPDFKGLKDLLPSLPGKDQSLLPSIKKVYPTGEKPLVVVTFKCPIEMVGVNVPVTKILHGAVNLGMDAVNASNLLSFNLQQVCQ